MNRIDSIQINQNRSQAVVILTNGRHIYLNSQRGEILKLVWKFISAARTNQKTI